MAITRYESCYNKMKEQVEQIRSQNEYIIDSTAFAHWYLEKHYKLSSQQIAEAIIDGGDDLGIDAILIDEGNKSLTVMRFKFPSKSSSINNEIGQGDILKTWNSFEMLEGNNRPYIGKNAKFREYKIQLQDTTINSFKICFVSYNKGIASKNRRILESKAKKFREDTGSGLELVYHERKDITNIYECLNHENTIKITLNYKQMLSAYDVESRKIKSYVGFVSGIDLVEATKSYMASIFDENIRLYEYASEVNTKINKTATSANQADMFYFYNNGIVFICNKAEDIRTSNAVTLTGVSIVNGCQSLNVLYSAFEKGKLNSKVCILVRIIEIADYNERMHITEFLNTQTPIKDSYFIANHTIVRDLQKQLREKGYYLERQINEVKYLREKGEFIDPKNIIQLEDAIQYYVGYWVNRYASLAKRGKGALFDKNKIEDLLANITAEKIIIAVQTYQKISEVLTMYRRFRRNSSKKEFAEYIGLNREVLLEHIEEFLYVNTGDIILLNAVANLSAMYQKLGVDGRTLKDLIIDAIFIIRQVIIAEDNRNYSTLTKSAGVFTKVQKSIQNLDGIFIRPNL